VTGWTDVFPVRIEPAGFALVETRAEVGQRDEPGRVPGRERRGCCLRTRSPSVLESGVAEGPERAENGLDLLGRARRPVTAATLLGGQGSSQSDHDQTPCGQEPHASLRSAVRAHNPPPCQPALKRNATVTPNTAAVNGHERGGPRG